MFSILQFAEQVFGRYVHHLLAEHDAVIVENGGDPPQANLVGSTSNIQRQLDLTLPTSVQAAGTILQQANIRLELQHRACSY
jgi:hypothetical protein